MRSKTSFFNKTVYRKNLTRFAPLWVLYTICLVGGLGLLWEGTSLRETGFAWDYQEFIQIMAFVNLVYAPVVAALLFKDLYNSRMCNMLHAMPLCRETWFVTNFLSGLTFSLVPTAVFALVSVPLLMQSIYSNAWMLAPAWLLAVNLQFVCFFGMACFAAMCVGNLLTLAAGYGLLQGGAFIVWWVADTVYTPMLYGVVTPTRLAFLLTPLIQFIEYPLATMPSRSDLMEQFGEELIGAVGTVSMTGEWWRFFLWAAVGLGFAVLALVLYRKRDLEAAGDAVAFSWLVPVFQVLCTLFVTVAPYFCLVNILGVVSRGEYMWGILAVSLVVGWFVAKMFIERSTRVFRLKNCYGLVPLAAVLAVTLLCTHFDVLGIEDRIPEAEKIKTVRFSSDYSGHLAFSDVEAIRRFHALALEDRADGNAVYIYSPEEGWVECFGITEGEEPEDALYRYSTRIRLTYELTNGSEMERNYYIWTDSPAGEAANALLSSWECIGNEKYRMADSMPRLEYVLDNFMGFEMWRLDKGEIPRELHTLENAYSFLEAVKKDCEAGTMNQNAVFHTGHFRIPDQDAEKGYEEYANIRLSLCAKQYTWDILIFADAENTVRWLQDHGLLDQIAVREESIRMW